MKNFKLIKILILVPLLPLLLMFFAKNTNIFLITDQLVNRSITKSLIAISLFYMANIIFRFIYSRNDEKKYIAPLSFIFFSNLINLFVIYLGSISVFYFLNFDLNTNISASFIISLLFVTISSLDFDGRFYISTTKTTLKESLEKIQIDTQIKNIITTIFLIFLFLILIAFDKILLESYLFIAISAIWNLLFSHVIRPQLFNLLENE